ncbi:DUF3224 domain-containing protein [Silvimonas sp.]|uniref:DUF3224 domain-containing protein n=1 Tax=Silvimonas sp. TaxID=2650811 RepID=UPI00284510E1|nr:DUF3224 domain-containing protein [Silvimonas sp.]MDR3428388.1 DUF3224 domain-containing protein [Silvimonas sp.]
MATQINGAFDVTLTPLAQSEKTAGASLGRMGISKQFHGDLSATSKGEMLSAMTDTAGSAGYVAIEQVTGSLVGRNGSFVLQHSGSMARGVASLRVTVVPDSATDELVGLTGEMAINIVDGKHFYEFSFTLPA